MKGKSLKLTDQIRVEAVDGASSLTGLLRKCQILASRLRNQDFKRWVSCELNGYKDTDELPPYRKLAADSIGSFAGYGGRMMNNAPIPTCNLPKKVEDFLSFAPFAQGVGSIEQLLRDSENGQISARWPANLIACYQQKFYEGFNLIEAHRIISHSAVAGMLEIIRNRVLEFVLELEERFPELDLDESVVNVKSDAVQSIVNNYILGDGNRIASCCENANQSVLNIVKGNWDMLEATLDELKISAEDKKELKSALVEDPPTDTGNLGQRTSRWLGRIMGKIGTGFYDIGVSTVSNVLATAICRYCGFTN